MPARASQSKIASAVGVGGGKSCRSRFATPALSGHLSQKNEVKAHFFIANFSDPVGPSHLAANIHGNWHSFGEEEKEMINKADDLSMEQRKHLYLVPLVPNGLEFFLGGPHVRLSADELPESLFVQTKILSPSVVGRPLH